MFEYEVATLMVTDIQEFLRGKAAEGWQVHTMTLVGGAISLSEDGTNTTQEIPLFTILLHRMAQGPEETQQEDDQPRAMAMKG